MRSPAGGFYPQGVSNGAGGLGFPGVPMVGAWSDPVSASLADLDGDGRPDLAVAGSILGAVSLHLTVCLP